MDLYGKCNLSALRLCEKRTRKNDRFNRREEGGAPDGI